MFGQSVCHVPSEEGNDARKVLGSEVKVDNRKRPVSPTPAFRPVRPFVDREINIGQNQICAQQRVAQEKNS